VKIFLNCLFVLLHLFLAQQPTTLSTAAVYSQHKLCIVFEGTSKRLEECEGTTEAMWPHLRLAVLDSAQGLLKQAGE